MIEFVGCFKNKIFNKIDMVIEFPILALHYNFWVTNYVRNARSFSLFKHFKYFLNMQNLKHQFNIIEHNNFVT